MRQPIFVLLLLFAGSHLISRNDSLKIFKKRGAQFYMTWGYTRAMYSKSTIHFRDVSGRYHDATGKYANYDFTVYNVKAKDRPDFHQIPDVVNLTIPQYVIHAGYMFNNKWGVELNYDHTKYVVTDWQRVHISGEIDGKQVDGDTILDPVNFLHFEHTDGANFGMLNAVRKIELYHPSSRFILSAVVKPGAGIVVPRTDVTLFGERLNNAWHIAGWIVGVESGLRLEFARRGFFEFVGKGVYAGYERSLVLGKGNGNASHRFFAGQLTATIGLRFDGR